MAKNATYKKLEQRVKELERQAFELRQTEEALRRERDTLQELLAKIKVLSQWYADYVRSL
jgi:prefoldin subunit 5